MNKQLILKKLGNGQMAMIEKSDSSRRQVKMLMQKVDDLA